MNTFNSIKLTIIVIVKNLNLKFNIRGIILKINNDIKMI